MERRAKGHGVYGEEPVIGKNEDDHLEQVPGLIWTDDQLSRRVAVGIDVDDVESVVGGVEDADVVDTVPPRRAMDLHIPLV